MKITELITEAALDKKIISYALALILIFGGIYSYQKIGRLEFPTFTIPTAVVITPYPGASAEEVEQEITDPIEQVIQQLSQIKKVRSVSKAGLSIIYVDLKDKYGSKEIPQIWDELRRKVSDIQSALPPGCSGSRVDDDFGDEYGVFFAIHGEGFSYNELKDYADLLKRELLLVKNVASVQLWGEQTEVITLEFSRAKMSQLGISVQQIISTLNNQNQIVDSGSISIDDNYVRINPTGAFSTAEDLGELLIKSDQKNNIIYLKDVFNIKKGFQDPASWIMHYNGMSAIGIGISTVADGNVVEMGKEVRKRMNELKQQMPIGVEIGYIAYQSDTVSESVNDFIINLIEAIIIVIAVLCISMGLSSGLLMGAILLLTIFGTFIFMKMMGITFQLISLGALILALGMLVDNAIVVTEGILVKTQRGMKKRKAAIETVKQTAWPLLGATFVAILAFAAIGTSKDSTGEFLGSLFLVMAISLGLSWVLAITLTPLFGVRFLPTPKNAGEDAYDGIIYKNYKKILTLCLKRKWTSIFVLILCLITSIYGFSYVENSFFPSSRRPQFLIDYMRPEGTHINHTEKDIRKIEKYLTTYADVTATTSFIGQGALRFLLTYESEMPNSSYGQILVTVDDHKKIDTLLPKIRLHLTKNYPDADITMTKFSLGPGGGAKVEARFIGPDTNVLRDLALQARTIMAKDPAATEIKDNFRQKTMTLNPVVKEAPARRLGITRPLIADALSANYTGKTIGLFREKNTLIPIQIKAIEPDRQSASQINDMTILSPVTGENVPLKQVVSKIDLNWEDPVIHRINRKKTITAKCNQLTGNASVLFQRLKPQIEAIELPPGYEMEWGGEYENSKDAQASLFKMIPVFFLAMVFVVLILFNAVRQTLIIFLCLPLSIIGLTSGLLISGQPFGFMCLLGFLGLSGMLIKNAIVLLDQIDLELKEGKEPFAAIVDSCVSRLRPVMMATITTVLGMLPLLTDPFYIGMSITIISGLIFGTLLTLIIVPVLYASMFRIRTGTE
jgi:multidrug efflux pump subunit AcrB